MIEVEQIFNKLDLDDKIRCLNFCEIEFGYCGYYGRNNLEEIKEALICEYECSQEEIIDMLYKNDCFNEDEVCFYTNGRTLESISENIINDNWSFVTDNICNGELKEMIEDMINDTINY